MTEVESLVNLKLDDERRGKCELCNCWADANIDGHKLCSGHYPWYEEK